MNNALPHRHHNPFMIKKIDSHPFIYPYINTNMHRPKPVISVSTFRQQLWMERDEKIEHYPLNKNFKMTLHLLLISLFFTGIVAQSTNPCVDQNTCSKCIQTKGCAWCLELLSGEADAVRCHPKDSIKKLCSNSQIEDPLNAFTITKERTLTQQKAKSGEEIVQIFPQRMNLKLRISEFWSFFIEINPKTEVI